MLYEFIYTKRLEGISLWKKFDPVYLSLHRFYFQIITHFFYDVYYLQCLILENKIITNDD